MPILLVRHAHAGSRFRWDGDDDTRRPLSEKGRRQAAALVPRLAAAAPTRILSSPYLRCMQTVEPIAAHAGLTIEETRDLAESRPFAPVLELIATLPEGSVLCSHGDVIPDTINALLRRGMTIDGEPEWGKASVWSLDRDGDGGVLRAKAWPPPG